VINRIVHKHASVGIKAEHYPIVGRHLLDAIQEVLGEAATPELISAWAEAYGELAAAFIAAEKARYAQAGTEPGQLNAMRVIEIRDESEDIKAFVLETVNGQEPPAFRPGQYLSVSVTFEDGSTQARQYSLSDSPNPHSLRISVKRERPDGEQPDGRVSNWLHQHVQVGSILKVSHPFGDFTADTEAAEPIVLLSAGVGITPMISKLNLIARTNPRRHVTFVHAARGRGHLAHRADIAAAKAAMPNLVVATFLETLEPGDAHEELTHAGMMDIAKVPAWPYDDADVYLCGPVGFMQQQWRSLTAAGVPETRLHREVFGPELLNYAS
jgi:nitric oxide dioxygenase